VIVGYATSPLRLRRASSASLLSVNEIKANPLDLPVSLSIITFASDSVPNRPKASLRSSFVVYSIDFTDETITPLFITQFDILLTGRNSSKITIISKVISSV
jgi:hypothetical protein